MNYIENLTRSLAASILHKKLDRHYLVDETGQVTTSGLLLWQLDALVAGDKINEAENLLFEWVEQQPLEAYLLWGLAFYQRLAAMEDAQLAALDFSRPEIQHGLEDLQAHFTGPPYNLSAN